MKYIRTKDGIVLNPALLDCGNNEFGTYMGEDARQADTIEKLCDSFVMFCSNAHCRKIRVYETMHSISLYFKRDKRWSGNMVDKVYGAIWTDKGLIYVAKMNEKGELELL